MKRGIIELAALTLAGVSFSAQAQQTKSYFYDVDGRPQATTKVPVRGESVGCYGLDGADNRIERLTETVLLRPPVRELHAGQFIVASQFIPSVDGRFVLMLQTDGNLVLYGPPDALWRAMGIHGQGPTTLTMQSDGNLTVRGPTNNLIWQSGTGAIPVLGSSFKTTAIWSSTSAGRPFGRPGPAASTKI